MKLGVFGGTFDPVHVGHLIVAGEVGGRLGLDEVLFVPAGQPWLKVDREVTPGPHRLRMVEVAIASNPLFRVSDMEVCRKGSTYTVDTLTQLKERLGEAYDLYLIVGLDALTEVDRWHQPQRMLELATLVGVVRPGFEKLERGPLEAVRRGAAAEVVVVDGPLVGVSATEIRHRVSSGLSIRYLVPEAVEAYICEHGLYKGPAGSEGG